MDYQHIPEPRTKCTCCDGTGEMFDHKGASAFARRERMFSQVPLYRLATALMLSKSYLCQIEQAHVPWPKGLYPKYFKELLKLTEGEVKYVSRLSEAEQEFTELKLKV